jgi:hypothetical protein
MLYSGLALDVNTDVLITAAVCLQLLLLGVESLSQRNVPMLLQRCEVPVGSKSAESPLFRSEIARMYACFASGHDAVLLSGGVELCVVAAHMKSRTHCSHVSITCRVMPSCRCAGSAHNEPTSGL